MCAAVGRVLFVEGNEDFAVHRADGGGIAQGDVDAAVGQADVVENDVDLVVADDLADGGFDLGEIVLGLLDARAGRGADVQAHLAGIHLREEIHAQSAGTAGRKPPSGQRRRRP